MQVQPSEPDALGCTLLKLDRHAAISYTPTAAAKAMKEKLRGSRDRRSGHDKDRDRASDVRSPQGARKDEGRDIRGGDEREGGNKEDKRDAAAVVGKQETGVRGIDAHSYRLLHMSSQSR